MWFKKSMLLIAIGAALALTGCFPRKGVPPYSLEGTPGGPIIVVRPTPEPDSATNKGKIQCLVKPCWYVGSTDAANWGNLPSSAKRADDKEVRLPHFLNHNAVVYKMDVKQKNSDLLIHISKITLTLDTGKLEIEVPELWSVPDWSFSGATPGNKWFRSRSKLSKQMLAQITAIEVTERPDQPAHPPVTLDNLDEFRMSYYQ